MRALFLLVLYLLITITACVPSSSGLQITKYDDGYTFDWSGCTLAQVLDEAYSQLGVQAVAMLRDNDMAKPPFRCERDDPGGLHIHVAGSFEREIAFFDRVRVLTPRDVGREKMLEALPSAQRMTIYRFVASLTNEQLLTLKTSNGIPFSKLADHQKESLLYLAQTWTESATFPEPELSKRLEKSKAILAIHPRISFQYPGLDEDGQQREKGWSFSCSPEAEKQLWRSWATGQSEAGQIAIAAAVSPSDNAPGDSTMCQLQGIYRLSDLLQLLQKELSVRSDPVSESIQIAAYCDTTKAALAKTLAATTGMRWVRQKDGWLLTAFGGLPENLQVYSRDARQEYDKMCRELQPQVKEVVRSGYLILVADTPWKGIDTQRQHGDPIQWGSLTYEQQQYLRGLAEIQNEYTLKQGYDLVENISSMKMHIEFCPKLYIATEDSILMAEWFNL